MSLNIAELIDDKSQIRMMLIQMDMTLIGSSKEELEELNNRVKQTIVNLTGELTSDDVVNAIALTRMLEVIALAYNSKKKSPMPLEMF